MDDHILLKQFEKKYSPEEDLSHFDYFNFLFREGSPLLALFYSRLFWPEFIEYKGMIFLKETLEDESDIARLNKVLEKYKNKHKTEKAFNTTEIPELFAYKYSDDLDNEGYYLLAKRLIEMWECRLHMLYPKRKFKVELLEPDNPAEDEMILTFYQASGLFK